MLYSKPHTPNRVQKAVEVFTYFLNTLKRPIRETRFYGGFWPRGRSATACPQRTPPSVLPRQPEGRREVLEARASPGRGQESQPQEACRSTRECGIPAPAAPPSPARSTHGCQPGGCDSNLSPC